MQVEEAGFRLTYRMRRLRVLGCFERVHIAELQPTVARVPGLTVRTRTLES